MKTGALFFNEGAPYLLPIPKPPFQPALLLARQPAPGDVKGKAGRVN